MVAVSFIEWLKYRTITFYNQLRSFFISCFLWNREWTNILNWRTKVTSGSPKHSVQIMTGTGSGYIGNGCVLNPFCLNYPFISSWLFPFYRSAFRTSLYSDYPTGKKSSYNSSVSLFYLTYAYFPTLHAESRLFFCKFWLSAVSSSKDRWRLQPKNLPPRLRWRAYFSLPPCPYLPPILWAKK